MARPKDPNTPRKRINLMITAERKAVVERLCERLNMPAHAFIGLAIDCAAVAIDGVLPQEADQDERFDKACD